MNAPDARNAAISCAGEPAEDRELRETLADLFGDCDAEHAETDAEPAEAPSPPAPPPSHGTWPYTVRQAAAATGRSCSQIYRLIYKYEIVALQAPTGARRWLIPAEEVHKLLPAPPERPTASTPTDDANEPPS